MATYRLAHGDLHYSDRGTGRALVLLHGFPLDARIWDPVADRLAGKYRVITPDLPGFGRSRSTAYFTIASLAADVHALCAGIGASPCVLAGLSMGGYIALAFAAAYPDTLAGLALVDTKAAADTPAARANRDRMIGVANTAGSSAIAAEMMPNMLSPTATAPVRSVLQQMMESCPAPTIAHALAALRDRADYTDLLPKIAVPAAVIVGEDDAIASPDVARSMHERLGNSLLRVIPGAGHMAPLEQPEAVARALDDLIQILPD